MKILLLSQNPWRKDNSFGNTYSNIFGKMENIEIAHIYTLNRKPEFEKNVTRYYHINEAEVIKSFFSLKRDRRVGKEIKINEIEEPEQFENKHNKSFYSKVLSFGKNHHWISLFWARELAWKYGNVDYKGLIDFVNDFKPDLFFLPYGNMFNTNRLALYIKKHTDTPMVMHMAMDHYSLKRVSFNPLFWIDRYFKRRMIRKLAKQTELIYCISDRLKRELEKCLNVPCKLLYKIPDSDRHSEPYMGINNPVRFLFAGNIYANRWKVLALLAESLKKKNFGHLDIYTASPITKDIDKRLNIEGFSSIHGPVSQNDVIRLQKEADVLVHVESFDIRNKLLVKCAISTKIMDYLSVGRSILAIGPKDVASLEYLSEGNLAMVANSREDLERIIDSLKANQNILFDYSSRGDNYIKQNLDPTALRRQLYNELSQVVHNSVLVDYP